MIDSRAMIVFASIFLCFVVVKIGAEDYGKPIVDTVNCRSWENAYVKEGQECSVDCRWQTDEKNLTVIPKKNGIECSKGHCQKGECGNFGKRLKELDPNCEKKFKAYSTDEGECKIVCRADRDLDNFKKVDLSGVKCEGGTCQNGKCESLGTRDSTLDSYCAEKEQAFTFGKECSIYCRKEDKQSEVRTVNLDGKVCASGHCQGGECKDFGKRREDYDSYCDASKEQAHETGQECSVDCRMKTDLNQVRRVSLEGKTCSAGTCQNSECKETPKTRPDPEKDWLCTGDKKAFTSEQPCKILCLIADDPSVAVVVNDLDGAACPDSGKCHYGLCLKPSYGELIPNDKYCQATEFAFEVKSRPCLNACRSVDSLLEKEERRNKEKGLKCSGGTCNGNGVCL